MYEDTPNKEEIDWLEERIREVYNYERLKDCDIDYLYNREFGMKSDTNLFEVIFPAEGSVWQGEWRKYTLDDENEDREALTEAERLRLRMLEREAEMEIHRAYGHRKELHRKHRNKLANSISDMFDSLGAIFPWNW